eukprot:12388831-Alexandrium_andersonii.AAC.1
MLRASAGLVHVAPYSALIRTTLEGEVEARLLGSSGWIGRGRLSGRSRASTMWLRLAGGRG